jgi:hypothetical protein
VRGVGTSPRRRCNAEIEYPTIEINFILSRSDVEILLAGFLTGAVGVELRERLDISELPAECCKHVGVAEASGRPWTAWSTERGPMAAWGEYHPEPSRRLYALLLWLEWWTLPHIHHAGWWCVDPRRPRDWTKING